MGRETSQPHSLPHSFSGAARRWAFCGRVWKRSLGALYMTREPVADDHGGTETCRSDAGVQVCISRDTSVNHSRPRPACQRMHASRAWNLPMLAAQVKTVCDSHGEGKDSPRVPYPALPSRQHIAYPVVRHCRLLVVDGIAWCQMWPPSSPYHCLDSSPLQFPPFTASEARSKPWVTATPTQLHRPSVQRVDLS
jgi:hypothetical protein